MVDAGVQGRALDRPLACPVFGRSKSASARSVRQERPDGIVWTAIADARLYGARVSLIDAEVV